MSKAIVLIPVRNEAATIGRVVRGCLALELPLEVWVIDDGSQDDSATRAAREGARVLKNPGPNRGKTAALRHALKQVSDDVDWIFTMDGDGQHEPADLARFWRDKDEADILVGNRLPDAAAMPRLRRLTNQSMSGFLRACFGVQILDTQCGLRLIRKAWLENWLPQGHRFEFETELSLLTSRRPSRIKNISIPAIYGRERSKIRPFLDALNFAKTVTIKR